MVFDKTSVFTFIIDSGASRSVIPARNIDLLNKKPDPVPLIGTDGKNIKTFSNRKMRIDLGTTNKYQQDFTIAKVEWPILGADFLSKFDLRIDLKKRILINHDKTETIKSVTTIRIISYDEEEPQPKCPMRKKAKATTGKSPRKSLLAQKINGTKEYNQFMERLVKGSPKGTKPSDILNDLRSQKARGIY